MSTWLYQLNPKDWSPETFRYEIWEGKQWRWRYGQKRGKTALKLGDTLVFYYSKTGGNDPGIYGWAVLDQCDEDNRLLYFMPASPTNHLKMDPWWDEMETKKIVDRVRGPMKQATLFEIEHEDLKILRAALRSHLSGA